MATVTKLATGAASASLVFTNGSWSSEANARDGTAGSPDNNTYATCTTAGRNKESGSLWPFVFSTTDVPVGSTINSVTVALQWKGSSTSTNYTLRSSAFDGSNDSTATLLSANPGVSASGPPSSDTNASYTLTTTPTQSQLASGIYVRVSALQGGTATAFTASLDYITVTVNYTLPNTAPTVALNSPTDTGTVSTTTPQLTFTGSDSESDAISYEVEVATDAAFAGATTGNMDSYSAAVTSNSSFSSAASTKKLGQSFTGDGNSIISASMNLVKTGTPTGNIVYSIYAHTGTFGAGTPTGSALATSDVLDVTILTTSSTAHSLSFSTPFTTTSGTHYFLVVEPSGTMGDSSNTVGLGAGGDGTGSPGNMADFSGTSWSVHVQARDAPFTVVETIPATLILDKLSNTDSGFTDITNGGDTDPFASGDQIGYTIQAGDALTNGTTYYWRVRGIDPSGSNTYGAWSSTRSFTVSTSGGGGTPTNLFFDFF